MDASTVRGHNVPQNTEFWEGLGRKEGQGWRLLRFWMAFGVFRVWGFEKLQNRFSAPLRNLDQTPTARKLSSCHTTLGEGSLGEGIWGRVATLLHVGPSTGDIV